MDMKLELLAVPVSDVDRAKAFYTEKFGFNADFDETVSADLRFVQLTPPGSSCSICIGTGLTKVPPGSLDMVQLVVANAREAHDELAGRGADVSDVVVLDWGSFVYLSDPDGNRWSLQEVPKRG